MILNVKGELIMEKINLGNSDIKVSRIGIGGHYKAMEEGSFEARYAYVDKEVESRVELIKKAIDAGINYFDTTWRNEVKMLGMVLEQLKARERVFVNGMVLGAFAGSKALGEDVEDYFNKWLEDRLETIPGGRFDTFMVNAIEEAFDDTNCERLVKLLEKRRKAGDFEVYGFSCHNPEFARTVADKFPEFQIIMTPYNFRNRGFEKAFEDYNGTASFIAMKPLVWAEYGIPFCAVNNLPNFKQNFGFEPKEDASAKAIKFLRNNPKISTVFCAVNSMEELDLLIKAGEGEFTKEDEDILSKYNELQTIDNGVPLYLSGLKGSNIRKNFHAVTNLSRALGLHSPDFKLNESDTEQKINEYAQSIMKIVKEKGYGKYI